MKLFALIILLSLQVQTWKNLAIAGAYTCSMPDGTITYNYSECTRLNESSNKYGSDNNENNSNCANESYNHENDNCKHYKRKRSTAKSLQAKRQKELNKQAKNFDKILKSKLKNAKKMEAMNEKKQKQLLKKQQKCENINLDIEYANSVLQYGVSLIRRNALEQKLKKLYLQRKIHCRH